MIFLEALCKNLEDILQDLQDRGDIDAFSLKSKPLQATITATPFPRDIVVSFIASTQPAHRSSNQFSVVVRSMKGVITNEQDVRRNLGVGIFSRKKGIWHERLVFYILAELKEKGAIEDYYKTNTHQDRAGQDFVIRYFNEFYEAQEMPLQVKSSQEGLEEHQRSHPDIPSVAVLHDDDYYSVQKKIRAIITAHGVGSILHI